VETTAAFWTDAELYMYMSDAESDINQLVSCYELTTTAASVTATSGYTLPSDLISLTRVEYDGYPLKQIDQRDRYRLDQPGYGGTLTQGKPTHCWLYGTDMVYLWPTPDSAKTITYYYTAEPADISTASTAFSVPQQYHSAIQDYVLYRCFAKDQDQAKAEWHKREYMQAVMDARTKEQRRRWAGGFPCVKSESHVTTFDGIV